MTKASDKRKLGDNPQFMRVLGSMPWLKARDKQEFRTKVFQSGNSIAVRIPAGTRLEVGMEMELTIEDGQFLSYDPIDAPKRKFDIAKVAGSAKGLKYSGRDDRSFEPRPSSISEKDRGK